MSAETLRFAATTMRLEARYKDVPNELFLEAVADLLDEEARLADLWPGGSASINRAHDVASAYLGEGE